jgi:hypothetical protein
MTPAVTLVGSPTGNAVTAVIGTAGGSVTSADGKVKITLPAGALAGDTTVGIQPISNMAPGGLGDAYRLTPEGTQFAAPATLSFALSTEDLNGTTLSQANIASQNASGQWQVSPVSRDVNSRTLTVSSSHFSDWSRVSGLQLRPPSATLPIGKSTTLHIRVCYLVDEGDDLFSLLADCQDDLSGPLPPNSPLNWQVNGTLGGSDAVGTLSADGIQAVYTAPGQPPAANPVAVSVTYAGQILVSNINVVSALQYSGTISSTLESNYSYKVSVTWTQNNNPTPPVPPDTVAYQPSGTVTWTLLPVDGIVSNCTFSQNTFDIAPADGFLFVFYDGEVPTYYGGGGATRQVMETCPDLGGGTTTQPFNVVLGWWPGTATGLTVDQDGTIEGTETYDSGTATWSFTPSSAPAQ